ncbi:HypC/HybG/HupF family hydrogenase formation chaperone [uncultured Paracoccus sp.]|uniref:HypC/HybG/HupF family hydrogenase formation chaperone n=1 Tax=uncultured Paracoccus sp. TaxID=189685 RepID=UPI002591DD50|nr:HypC/HybG/HupF family hydrogenase formation chaperone [uncultured Paracoccus sp.]
MCMGIPMRLVHVNGIAGQNDCGDLIDLSLTPDAQPGDWVLTFLGTAHEVIGPDRAAQIAAALQGLRAVMAGGDASGAFADLEARAPVLPSHLQAALAAGRTTG